MSKAATTTQPAPSAPTSGWRSLLTTDGRASRSFRFRVGSAFAAIIGLHLLGLGLLTIGVAYGAAGAVTIGVAAIAYFRGLVHSYDFDHVSHDRQLDPQVRRRGAQSRQRRAWRSRPVTRRWWSSAGSW